MQLLAGSLSLLIAVAGWFYLFYSRAAHRLTGLEQPTINSRRIALRRLAGAALFLLAVLFYWGFITLDRPQAPIIFISIWASVMALLLLILGLGFIDLRYTLKFYRERNGEKQKKPTG
jgi:hypothetical protein